MSTAPRPPNGRQPRSRFLRWVLAAIACAGLLAVAWAGARYLEYRREEPLRNGIAALKDGNYPEALAKIAPFARNGNKLARELLSMMHARGFGVAVDNVRAQIWIRRAECSCDVPGAPELNLAHGFLEGTPLPKDAVRALYWLQRAAEAGNTDAQRLLADPEAAARRQVAVPPDVKGYWREYLKSPE